MDVAILFGMVIISVMYDEAGLYTLIVCNCVGTVILSMHLLRYKVLLQAMIDKKQNSTVCEAVEIIQIAQEYKWGGGEFNRSSVRLFYPKELGVDRYKIIVRNGEGGKKKIRTVMSKEVYSAFFNLDWLLNDHKQICRLKMTYLTRSKILLYVELAVELREGKLKREAEEELQCINRPLPANNRASRYASKGRFS